MAEFDAAAYLTIPNVDTASLIALATKLLTAAPAPLPEALLKPVKQTRLALEGLQRAYASHAPGGASGLERRRADAALDNAWGALHKRLAAWPHLPSESHPEVAEARHLLEVLFADGLAFLALSFEAEWAESDRRLRLVDAQGLGDAVERLAGGAFLAEVRRAHAAYGDALGITTAREAKAPAASLGEPHAELRSAVRSYARKVVGLVDDDDFDSVSLAQRALEPIVEARAAARRRAAGTTAGSHPGGDDDGDVETSAD